MLTQLTRELWDSLAWLLTEKRMPEEALVYLEPLAERFAPWPELDLAVARAYREVLDPESARRFLERARLARPQDAELLLESARCAQDLDDSDGALGFLERAVELQPGRAELERALALALVARGDPRGRAWVERLLAGNPEDPELLDALARTTAPGAEEN
jgi:tetratricopeptide (TPR) repeat protein